MSHQPTKSLTKTSKWLPNGQAKHERCLPKGHAGIQVFLIGGGGGWGAEKWLMKKLAVSCCCRSHEAKDSQQN